MRERKLRRQKRCAKTVRYRVTERKYHRVNGENRRVVRAVVAFFATSLSILLLPFALIDAGCKKIGKGAQKRALHSHTKSWKGGETKHDMAVPSQRTASHQQHAPTVVREEQSGPASFLKFEKEDSRPINSNVFVPPISKDRFDDEEAPRSIPKSEGDQYVRRRLTVAGSYYCDSKVLAGLEIGSYLDVVLESDNPYDRNAVKLLYRGEKVGYVPKADKTPFVASLKLGRTLYGVITDIVKEQNKTGYEFEIWVEKK